MKKNLFKSIKMNWDDKVTNSDDLFSAVGRSKDDAKLMVIVEDVVSKLNLCSEDNLVEVGCGTGVLLSKLNAKVGSVKGLDYSSEAIGWAVKVFPDIEFTAGNAAKLPYKSEIFNKAVCYSVFHYFADMEYAYRAIDELIRVTETGGRILLGDLPSKAHFHLSPYYRKLSLSEIYYRFMKIVIRIIKRRKRKKTPPAIDPKKWIWYDLDQMVRYVKNMGHSAQVLKQPQIIQWHEITYNHRFDILIQKK